MRFIIGIDLGTTNSAVGFVDMTKSHFPLQIFSIPQLTAPGKVEPLLTLPSFCYLPAVGEWPTGSLKLPWKGETTSFVGQFAKIQGAKVSTRLVQSAKSWLCNVAANRMDKILPIEAADLSQRLSPVEASAKYLIHLKEAWNASFAKEDPAAEFEEQEIILTVPASFDEIARTLTVEAARQAGLLHVTLLEEPQAAFYSWISQHEKEWNTLFQSGESILVVDVGGGTTDFSLIEIQEKEGKLAFHRMAVGDHLLLGGDNMDAALAHYLEQKLRACFRIGNHLDSSAFRDGCRDIGSTILNQYGGTNVPAANAKIISNPGIPNLKTGSEQQGQEALESNQWQQLLAEARKAKEVLLDETSQPVDTYSVIIQGTGSSVVKGSVSAAISQEELKSFLLEGFFGSYPFKEALQMKKRLGFRTMGLPYEDEPSIVKHLAHFLSQAGYAEPVKPIDYLLFNGGAMKPLSFQQALIDALALWSGKPPTLLNSASLDLAVARGAAYYGGTRRGHGVKIEGGLPRSYYIELDSKEASGKLVRKALTLLPRGSEEGTVYQPDQIFYLRSNTPVAFHLLTSHVRLHDKEGEMIGIDEQEMQRLPPIQTVLRFGRKQMEGEGQEIPVRLSIRLTAVGTLELWLESNKTEHRWNLEFQLRSATGQDHHLMTKDSPQKDETFDDRYLVEAKQSIETLFQLNNWIKPFQIMDVLEEKLGMGRREWSLSVLRGLWDSLFKCAPQRKISTEHEGRWWNLAGFFLRPGFGFPLDDFRMKELWKIILADLKGLKNPDSQIQRWICFRRVSGGLNKGQQMQLATELLSDLFDKRTGQLTIKRKSDLYLYSEKIRALAAMERLEMPIKIRLGEALLARMIKEEGEPYDYWALARIGARHLVYGSAGQVIPKETAGKWVEQLLKFKPKETKNLLFTLEQLARRTSHRELNLPDSLLSQVVAEFPEEGLSQRLQETRQLTQNEQEQLFGDQLPPGLILVE